MRDLSQGVLPAVAAPGSHEVTHRGEALRVRTLRQEVCRPIKPESSHADPQWKQDVQLQQMLEILLSQKLPDKTF